VERATGIAVGAVREFLERHPKIEKVIFCTFGREAFETYSEVVGDRR
jgi:O-acetyl-ADP-ribose deacetylase (regulator of RNase III)